MTAAAGLGANVGTAWVALRFSAKGAGASISKEIQGETTGLGSAIGSQAGKGITSSITKSLSGLGSKLTAVGKDLTAHLTLPIAAVAAESVHLATNFQASMEKVRTQAGASQKEVNKMSQAILNLAKSSQQTPEQLADALYHLESLGLRGSKALDALRTSMKLANISGADLEETTSAIGGAWRTGIVGAKSFSQSAATLNAVVGAGNMRMSDLLGALGTGILPAAKTFGLNLRQVGSAIALFTDEGVPAVDAATRLRMTFSLLGAPSKIAEGQLKTIGLSGLKLANTMRGPGGLIGAIQLLKDHLDKSGLSASKQAELLSKAFGGGRSSSAILSMLNNLDVLKKKQDQVNTSAGKFGPAVAAQSKTAAAKWAEMTSSLQRAGILIGNALIPVATSIARRVAGIAAAFANLPAPARKVILVVAGIAAAAGPALIVFGSLATGIGKVIKLGGLAAKGIMGIGGAAKSAYGFIGRLIGGFRSATVAESAFSGVAGTLGGNLRKVVTAIGAATTTAYTSSVAWLRNTAAIVANRVAQIACGVATKAMAAATWLLNIALDADPIVLVVVAIAGLVAGFVLAYQHCKTFRKIVQDALRAVKDVALDVVHWFTGTFVKFFTKTIPAVFKTVLDWVKKNWPWLLGALEGPIGLVVVWIIKHWRMILDGIKTGWDAVVGFVKTLPGKFLAGLESLGKMLFNLGKAGLMALWDGAKSALGAVLGFFKSIGSDIIGGLKKVFGIFSPSRQMFDIGKNLMVGLANGLHRHYPKVTGFFSRMGKGVTAGVQQWTSTVREALKMLGLPESLTGNVLFQMQTESGGNPDAINKWDINAQHGDPSRGLMQVIGSTFSAFHVPGTSWNIYNPLANVAAAINYARARYGPTLMSGGFGIGSGHGYDSGGIARGLGYMPKHTIEPERVLSPRQTSAFERLVDVLDGKATSRAIKITGGRLQLDLGRSEAFIRDLSAQEARSEIAFAVGG